MGMQIEGHSGGRTAGVDERNRLETSSVSGSIQHTVSHEDGLAFQVIGVSTLAASTVTALHLKNNSATKDVVVTYIRHQIVGGTGGDAAALPSVNNYYQVSLGRTRASGGSVVTPVNINTTSGNVADVTCYSSSPVMAGTANEIDRQYTKAFGDMNTFNKEGALIIGPNGTLELAYIGNMTAGIVYTRLSFIMQDR